MGCGSGMFLGNSGLDQVARFCEIITRWNFYSSRRGMMHFTAPISCIRSNIPQFVFQQSSADQSVFFLYSLYALIVYNMAFEISLSIFCLKSWILLYKLKIQHSGIVNLTVVTVRCETARNLRPFIRPAVRRTLVPCECLNNLDFCFLIRMEDKFWVDGELRTQN
jgi:hypothetical protein